MYLAIANKQRRGSFTQLKGSFDLVQAGLPLCLVPETTANGWKNFGFPRFHQQSVMILLHKEKARERNMLSLRRHSEALC